MEIIASVFIIVVGTLGHFLFEWCGHKKWAGVIFAVNESTWEHIKLTIYPALIWFVVEIAVRGFSAAVIAAQAAAMFTAAFLIPAIFYSYTAIIGKNYLVFDILCYCVSVVLSRWIFGIVASCQVGVFALIVSIVVVLGITLAYFTCSYHAPRCFLFKDPVSGGFGPVGHDCHSDFHTHNGHEHHHSH